MVAMVEMVGTTETLVNEEVKKFLKVGGGGGAGEEAQPLFSLLLNHLKHDFLSFLLKKSSFIGIKPVSNIGGKQQMEGGGGF